MASKYKTVTDVLNRKHVYGDIPLKVPAAGVLIDLRARLRSGLDAAELDVLLFDAVRAVTPKDLTDPEIKAMLLMTGWFQSPFAHAALDVLGLAELAKVWNDVEAAQVTDAEEEREDDDPTS